MPSFEFTSPEGKKYTVAGPDGATKEQAFAILQQQIAGGTAQAAADVPVNAPTKRGAVAEAAHQLGLTARYGIEGVAAGIGALTDPILNAVGGGVRAATGNNYQPATLAGTGAAAANALGLPQPEGSQERLVGALTRGLAGGATGAGVAGVAAKAIGGSAGSVTQAVMQNLAAAPVTQAMAGGAAGLAGQAVAEGGGSEGAQLAASLAAGVAGPVAAAGVARAARSIRPKAAATPVPTPQPADVPGAATGSVDPVDSQALSAITRDATEGVFNKKAAIQNLADQTLVDPKTVSAAKRLGIEDHLQPDHVTTNQAYRELAQAIKSVPGSEARATEMQGLEAVAKRASNLVDEYGGTHDLSTLDDSVKTRMQGTIDNLSEQADKAYSDLRAAIPARDSVSAPSVLKFIEGRAGDLGGAENLTSMERSIARKLTPKEIVNDAGETVVKQPTYALLDDVRRDLTAARIKGQGPFKDADVGLIKVLENNLQSDQRAAIQPYGQTEQFNAAQSLVGVRKGIEADMASLFGKKLNGSIVTGLKESITALPKGDTSRFVNFVKAIPEEMRSRVVASGLSTAFNVSAKNQKPSFTNFTNFYEGLLKNKQAHAAIMSNLPPEARKQLSDLYRVSKGVSMATRERITTGRIQAVTQDLKGPDSLMANIYGVAKRSAIGGLLEVGTSAVGLHGAGIAAGLSSALTKGKPDTVKAADKLINSPEFQAAVRRATEGYPRQASKQFAGSRAFKAFRAALKNQRAIGNPEAWIMNALTAHDANQANTNKKDQNAAR